MLVNNYYSWDEKPQLILLTNLISISNKQLKKLMVFMRNNGMKSLLYQLYQQIVYIVAFTNEICQRFYKFRCQIWTFINMDDKYPAMYWLPKLHKQPFTCTLYCFTTSIHNFLLTSALTSYCQFLPKRSTNTVTNCQNKFSYLIKSPFR